MTFSSGAARVGTLVAAVVLVLSGCTTMVDGAAKVAVPRPGSPVQWMPCEGGAGENSQIPSGGECGKLSVPVNYAKPDGDVAQIAMIRFPATG
jgi:hypothetical protein